MKNRAAVFFLVSSLVFQPGIRAEEGSEVFRPTGTQVAVREHPKTGKPYVTIIGKDGTRTSPALTGKIEQIARPDYRMLDPKVKSGQIPYHGPVSDRKKVYILAGTLATVGVAGSLAASTAIPAATASTGAAGGAGLYGAAGVGVITGTASGVWLKSRPNPHQNDFDLKSGSHEIREAQKIDKMIQPPVREPSTD